MKWKGCDILFSLHVVNYTNLSVQCSLLIFVKIEAKW